jgi:hypothetical protein
MRTRETLDGNRASPGEDGRLRPPAARRRSRRLDVSKENSHARVVGNGCWHRSTVQSLSVSIDLVGWFDAAEGKRET